MGKGTCVLLLLVLLLGAPAGAAAGTTAVMLNGEPVAFEHGLVWQNGRLLAPVRDLFLAMGAAVAWDDLARTVIAEMNGVEIKIPLGSYLPTVEGLPVALDVAALSINSRIYVPLRFAVTALGGEIAWEAKENTAYISMPLLGTASGEKDGAAPAINGRLELNSASLPDLLALDVLNEAAAADLIAYREANGPFRSFAELSSLPFLAGGLFERLVPHLQIVYYEAGIACWYGAKFHGRMTSSGEPYDKNLHTAAHRTLPFGTRVKVTFPQTGRSVWVRINDRGPHVAGRIIDLSRAAADAIGLTPYGLGYVELEILLER